MFMFFFPDSAPTMVEANRQMEDVEYPHIFDASISYEKALEAERILYVSPKGAVWVIKDRGLMQGMLLPALRSDY